MNGLMPMQGMGGGGDTAAVEEMLRKFLRDTGFAGSLEQLLRALASGGGATGALPGSGGTASGGGIGGLPGGGGTGGTGGGGCMDGETLVPMADGSLLAHSRIRVGDVVAGIDKSGSPALHEVTDVWETVQPRLEVRTSHGLPFVCSRSHPVMVSGFLSNGMRERRKVPAGELVPGAFLITPGGWAAVLAIKELEDGPVFGLTCGGNHTYWAADHLQHNKSKPAETPTL